MSAYLPSTVMETGPQLVTAESPREAERQTPQDGASYYLLKGRNPRMGLLLPVLTLLMVIFGFGQCSTASSLCQICLESPGGSAPLRFRRGSHPLCPISPAPSGTAEVSKGSICRALASPCSDSQVNQDKWSNPHWFKRRAVASSFQCWCAGRHLCSG